MLLVRDLKTAEANPLDERFLAVLPEECDVCGYTMSIQPTLTTLSCINPRCEDKIVARLVAALEKLRVKGIGKETAKAYVHEQQVINPLEILWQDGGVNLCESISYTSWKKVADQIAKRNQKGYYLSEVVQLLSIPGVQTSADKIFEGRTLNEVYTCLREGGVGWVQEQLGINADGGVSVRAVGICNQLFEYEEDLRESVRNLPIREKVEGVPEITVVCSTSVGAPFKTKKHFADTVEARYLGKANFKFSGSVTRATDYLVWSGADGSPAPITSKVKTAMKWNEGRPVDDPLIRIVTGNQLIEILDEEFNG